MVDIHVVHSHNRLIYRRQLDEQFRLRRQIFIGERKWPLRDCAGREVDPFDTPETCYLLGLTDDGAVAGAARLHASLGCTVLSEIFPHLANLRGIRRDSETAEWTRLFVAPRFRGESGRNAVLGALTCGVIQAALMQGFGWLNAVVEEHHLPLYLGLRWRLRLLGESMPWAGTDLVAFNVPIDDGMLERTRAFYGIALPRLLERGVVCPNRLETSLPSGA